MLGDPAPIQFFLGVRLARHGLHISSRPRQRAIPIFECKLDGTDGNIGKGLSEGNFDMPALSVLHLRPGAGARGRGGPVASENARSSETTGPTRKLSEKTPYPTQEEQRTRRAGDQRTESESPLKAVTPKFISGLRDGQPIYTEIRVASDKDANRTWRHICAMDITARAGAGGALVDQAILSPCPG